MLDATYPEDLSRIILIVSDAPVTHPTLRQDGVQASICHRGSASAATSLVAVDEGVHRGITAVVVLDFLVPAAAHDEERGSDRSEDCDDCDNHAGDNASSVGAAIAAAG